MKKHEPINKDAADVIAYIEEHGSHSAGRNELIKHLQGQPLTQKEAIKALCYDCNGYFSDGRADCEMPSCPIYPFMNYNPNKRGAKNLSEETRQAMSERMKERK